MRKGLCIINTFNKSEGYLYQGNRLKEAFKNLNVELEIVTTEDLFLHIENNGNIKLNFNLKEYDFAIFNDKDTVLSRMLEKKGLRVFNNSIAIETCDNKFLTHVCLSENNIMMPKTYPSFLCYSKNNYANPNYFLKISKEIGFPLIFKINYGSLGANVFLVNNIDELLELANKYKYQSFLIQEYIEKSKGQDIRVIVIGHKVVASMLRKNENDFRSNIGLGGKGYKIDLPQKASEIAVKVSKILNLDYCGVDILFDENNYYLCEVNSNAFFQEIEKVTSINVADYYARYIYDIIYK